MSELKFRIAQSSDLNHLVKLINLAYRQTEGHNWTSEADIVVGERINFVQLKQSLEQEHFQLWAVESFNEIVACIGLTFDQVDVEIGTFAISPNHQNLGLGRKILAFAEDYVSNEHQYINVLVMWVLSVRSELISYYERRGYVLTGVVDEYPLNANVGTPIVDLYLVEMKKVISKNRI